MHNAKSRITALATATVHGSIVTISCVFIALRPALATAATTLGASRATLKTASRGVDYAPRVDCNRACSPEEYDAARLAVH
jgi:hypothetical protein